MFIEDEVDFENISRTIFEGVERVHNEGWLSWGKDLDRPLLSDER